MTEKAPWETWTPDQRGEDDSEAPWDRTAREAKERAPGPAVEKAVKAATPAAKDYAIDLGKGVVQGLGRGVAGIPAIPGDVIDLINAGRNWWNGTPGAPHANPMPNSEDVRNWAAQKTGMSLPEPTTELGKGASNVASFLPSSLLGGAGVAGKAANVVRYGLIPGLASEAAGQAAHAFAPDYETVARIVGGLTGTAAGGKIMSPNLNHAPNAGVWNDAVDTLRGEGVPIDPGAASGKKSLTYLYDELNPERYGPIRGAFTQAAMRRGGVDGLATFGQDGTIPAVRRAAGQQFEDAIANSPGVQVDHPLVQNLTNRLTHVRKPGLYGDDVVNAVEGATQQISDLLGANNGVIPPREYQTLRSDLAEQARAMTDPRAGRLLHATVDDLDNAMERSIAAQGGDPAAFQQARDSWRRYLTLSDAADDASGYISPARLQNAVKKIYGEREVEENRTPFSELARAGDLVLGEAKSSGTAERAAAQKWLNAPGKALSVIGGGLLGHAMSGGGGGESLGGLLGALSAEHVGDVLSPVIRPGERVLLDNPVTRRYLGNQMAADVRNPYYVPGLLSASNAINRPRDREPLRVTVHPNLPPGLLQ